MKYPPLSANARHRSNKPLADDLVSARPGGFEGKFGEISGTNDVQPVTTGQYPHNLQGRNIDKHSSVIRRPGLYGKNAMLS